MSECSSRNFGHTQRRFDDFNSQTSFSRILTQQARHQNIKWEYYITDLNTSVWRVSTDRIFIVRQAVAGDDGIAPDEHRLAPRVLAAGVGLARVPLLAQRGGNQHQQYEHCHYYERKYLHKRNGEENIVKTLKTEKYLWVWRCRVFSSDWRNNNNWESGAQAGRLGLQVGTTDGPK